MHKYEVSYIDYCDFVSALKQEKRPFMLPHSIWQKAYSITIKDYANAITRKKIYAEHIEQAKMILCQKLNGGNLLQLDIDWGSEKDKLYVLERRVANNTMAIFDVFDGEKIRLDENFLNSKFTFLRAAPLQQFYGNRWKNECKLESMIKRATNT